MNRIAVLICKIKGDEMHVLGETTGRSGVVPQEKEGGGVFGVYPREIFVNI